MDNMEILDLLKELEGAAKKEDWEKVDMEIIPKIKFTKNFYAVSWAITKLRDSDDKIRDAAATIIQNGYEFSPEEWGAIAKRTSMALHMRSEAEQSRAVRYRLAIAFANNGVGNYKSLVISILKKAVVDEYVGIDAKNALNNLK